STFHPGGLIQTEPGSIVVIANLSLANSPGAAILLNQGTLAFNSSALIGNHGNGIINWGTLTINDGTVVGNGGDSGCVIDNSLPFPVPVLTVMNSRFSQNTSIPICNGCTATVSGSSFSGNSSPGGGGAIFNAGTLTVGDSLFVDNHASAIVNSGTATVSTSLFYGQSINWSAIVNLSGGALTIESSTLQKNFAPVGAAVYNEGTLTIRSSTISANTAVSAGAGASALPRHTPPGAHVRSPALACAALSAALALDQLREVLTHHGPGSTPLPGPSFRPNPPPNATPRHKWFTVPRNYASFRRSV